MNQHPILHRLLAVFGYGSGKASKPTLQLSTLPLCPTNDDRDAWSAYWKAHNQPWRTCPEIDMERQLQLTRCIAITPDIAQGIYPFTGMKLSRADVEWILAIHEKRRELTALGNRSQQNCEGLDLRGANLCREDLSELSLIGMNGGIGWYEGKLATTEQRSAAAIDLRGANLTKTHLENADLSFAYLEEACLIGAYLEKSILLDTHLKKVDLTDARIEKAELSGADLAEAILIRANLKGANLTAAHLEKAIFWHANLEMANLWKACLNGAALGSTNLKGADLFEAHLEGADLAEANLEGTNLFAAHLEMGNFFAAHLEGANLTKAHLEGACLVGAFFDSATQLYDAVLGNKKFGYVSLADVHWSDVNLTVLNWSTIPTLGDDHRARQRKWHNGKTKDKNIRLDEHRFAVRANRQLAVVLQTQGLNEDAAHFAYHAQVLQRRILCFQILQRGVKPKQRMQTLGAWLLSWFLFLLAGYGYKLGRSFLAYILVISAFLMIYHFLDPHLAWNEAFVVSMTAFHGRGFSPSEFKPGDPLALASAFEAFVGLIIEVTFIATLTQRFFSK